MGAEEPRGGKVGVEVYYVASSAARPQNLYRSPFNKPMQLKPGPLGGEANPESPDLHGLLALRFAKLRIQLFLLVAIVRLGPVEVERVFRSVADDFSVRPECFHPNPHVWVRINRPLESLDDASFSPAA